MTCLTKVDIILFSLVLLLSFRVALSRTVDELEDSVEALEKEYLQRLKTVQDLKVERDLLEKKISYRNEETKELARDRLQVVEEKKQRERSIEDLKFRLEVEDNGEVEELEKTFEKLSHTLEETEIEYRNTLLLLEKLKESVESDSDRKLLRLLEGLSPCCFSLAPSISNIILSFRVLFNVCEEISRILTRFLGFFIWQLNWLNFLEALFTLWLISFLCILHILFMRWCLKKLANDTIFILGSELLVILTISDWFAALVKVHISKTLLSITPISWSIFFWLLLGFFNGIQKFSYSTSFEGRCTAFFSMIGRFTLLSSFIYSCGRFPAETYSKISWTALLLFEVKDNDPRIFTSLCNFIRVIFLRIESSSNSNMHLRTFFKQYWLGALYKRRL
ncbi:hypothetical protein Gasu2_47310 [Galdieria sulphuraria]|nr:hypothetical protein Gasu2_47310 [Galdieria sulphuraria]